MSIFIFKNNSGNKGGFTLIEIIVSMAIFSVVAVVAAGALLKIIDANKKAQSIQASITNLNFALESMTRELRVGSKYQCGSGFVEANGATTMSTASACEFGSESGEGYIAFKSSETALKPDGSGQPCSSPSYNLAYEYRFKALNTTPETYTLEKAQQSQPTVSCGGVDPIYSSDFSSIISPKNVKITGYKISVIYDSSHQYPLASILISGYTGIREKDRTYFTVQTAASARLP